MTKTFSPGDYVVHSIGGIELPQVGRVAGMCPCGNTYFVCYSSGCAAVPTAAHALWRATAFEAEVTEAKIGPLGSYRFETTCPDTAVCDTHPCYDYCPHKRNKTGWPEHENQFCASDRPRFTNEERRGDCVMS